MRILEEFWYCNIELTEYASATWKELKEALHLITRNEGKLSAICIFVILHILHVLLESVAQMYLTFWDKK